MKYLKYYETKGLNSSSEVFDYLLETLKDSIFTWDYFTDFKKVVSNVKTIEKELRELNSLLGLSEDIIDSNLINLIKTNPKVRKAIPILVALRRDKLSGMPIIDDMETLVSTSKKELFDIKIDLNEELEKDFLKFFEHTGLKKFFVNKEITNLVDYCKGVEVGMDTNARKNRTGTNMENLLEKYVKKFCEKHNFQYIAQATKKKMLETWGVDIELDKIDRRFDFAIRGLNKELTFIEVNYYSSQGSKLKATAGEYKALSDFLVNQHIKFIWVTDGLGWHTAKTALKETFLHNDYSFNLRMVSEGIFNEILL